MAGKGGARRTHLVVACLSHLTIDHASFSRRSGGRGEFELEDQMKESELLNDTTKGG